MTNSTLPVAVAYFTVRVPATGSVEYGDDAKRVIERYLYSGAEVTDVDLDMGDFDHPSYILTVRTEGWKNVALLTGQVQYQRDRLSSGLYPSTEPKILFTPFADA